MPKVLLIQPSQYSAKTGLLLKYNRLHLPSLTLPLLAALTPNHWEVDLIYEIIEQIDFDADCDIVGIGTMGHSLYRAADIAKEFRKRGKIVFMGGYLSSLIPELITEHADGIVIGDAEISYPMLLADFESTGKIKKQYDHKINSLDNIPLPRYDLLSKKKIGIMLPVQASRGCPRVCSFCSTACIYEGKYLTRPIKDIIRDIKEIKNLGYKSFFLLDDNIMGDESFLEHLAIQIAPLKMSWSSLCSINLAYNEKLMKLLVASGCKMLGFGIESITQEGLNQINKSWIKANETIDNLKRIKKAGIFLQAGFMIGNDSDTEESINTIYKFVMKNKIAVPYLAILTPTPGSRYYTRLKNEDRIIHSDYSKYHAFECVHVPKKISPEKLEEKFWLLNDKIFSISSIFRRTIFTKYFIKNPIYCFFTFYTNIHFRKNIKDRNASIIF